MTDAEILRSLTAIFRQVFEDDTITLTPNTTADDIDQWDSMSQLTLAVEIEHHYRIKIRSSQMEEVQSVAGLMDLIKVYVPAGAH